MTIQSRSLSTKVWGVFLVLALTFSSLWVFSSRAFSQDDPGANAVVDPAYDQINHAPFLADVDGNPIRSDYDLESVGYLFQPVIAKNPDSEDWSDDTATVGIPLNLMPENRAGGPVRARTSPGPTKDLNSVHFTDWEWCPLTTKRSVWVSKIWASEKFYFETPNGERKALTSPDGKTIVDPSSYDLSYADLLYAAIVFDGWPVGTTKEDWNKWKSRFFKDGIVTNRPEDVNLEDPIYLQSKADHGTKTQFIPDGKTLFFVQKRQFFGGKHTTHIADITFHYQFINEAYDIQTYVSRAEVTTIADNKKFTLVTKSYKDASEDERKLKDYFYQSNKPYASPQRLDDWVYTDWPHSGSGEKVKIARESDAPLCHPSNLASWDGFDSVEEMQDYLRSIHTSPNSALMYWYVGDEKDDINLRSFPLLAFPMRAIPNSNADREPHITYHTSSERPGFTVVPLGNEGSRFTSIGFDHVQRVINTYSERPAEVKVEKFTKSERDESSMQVGAAVNVGGDDFQIHVVKLGTEEEWGKGSGENPLQEINEWPENINKDTGRHIVKGISSNEDPKSKAYEVPASANQDGPAHDVEIGFDIINSTPGSSVNRLIITDENILADTVPHDWQTGINGKESYFECTITKDQFLYPYRWMGSERFPKLWVPHNFGKSKPILVSQAINEKTNTGDPREMVWAPPREESTEGKDSVVIQSSWNPNTERQELYLANISLAGPAVGGGTAAPKIQCVTKLKVHTDTEIDISDFVHHDKVSVYGSRDIPVITVNPEDDANGKRKISSWTKDADNWWARVKPRAAIDIMSQVTHEPQAAGDRYFRHDFTAASGSSDSVSVIQPSSNPGISKPLNEFFRVSAGYQTRENSEHSALGDDLHKLRIKPQVFGTPVQACSPINMVSSSVTKVKEVTGGDIPPGITGYHSGNTNYVFFPRTATFTFYLGKDANSVTNENKVELARMKDSSGKDVIQVFKPQKLKGCTPSSCYYSLSKGGAATEVKRGDTTVVGGLVGIIASGRYFVIDEEQPVTVDATWEHVVEKGDGNWKSPSGESIPGENIVADEPLLIAKSDAWGVFLERLESNPYVPPSDEIGDLYPKNTAKVSVDPKTRTATYTFNEASEEIQFFVQSWKTTVTQGNQTAQIVWDASNSNTNDRQQIFGGPTIGLNGTLEFGETLSYSDTSTSYQFTVRGQTITVYYDPVTRVPVDQTGRHISGDFILPDPAGTKAYVNPIEKKLYINDRVFDLTDGASEKAISYTAVAPIKEITERRYRNYDPASGNLRLNDAEETIGCGPHTYRKPAEKMGQEALCDSTIESVIDAKNVHANDKGDTSHNFTTQDPVYAAEYDGKTYVVESVPNTVVKESVTDTGKSLLCDSPETLTIDSEGFIEFFGQGFDGQLSKDAQTYLTMNLGLKGLASGAGSYTRVDTYGTRVDTDDDLTLQPHASVEASYGHEPVMSVTKSAATTPYATTDEGIDVFQPGTLVDIRATMMNTGGTVLTDIQFEDSTGGEPSVDFTKRLVGDTTVDGSYYSIGEAEPSGYLVTNGVLYDATTGEKISVAPGETLTIYGVLTMNMPKEDSIHGDEVRFSAPGVTGSDSYRALADEPQVIVQKVTAGGAYSALLDNIVWSDCDYETPSADKCWNWKESATARLWEADGTNKLFLQPTNQGGNYVAPEQPVSVLVTNTGKTTLTNLIATDTTTDDSGGTVDWTDAQVFVGYSGATGLERVAGVTGNVTVAKGNDGTQEVSLTLLKDGETYALKPAKFDDNGELTQPGEFVVITGKLPAHTIVDGQTQDNDHSDTVQVTATSSRSGAQVVSNVNDWNTETLIPRIGVKKYSSEPGEEEAASWADPTGKPGDAQDSENAVQIPLERYTSDGRAVTQSQDVRILVTNEGVENLSHFKISDESRSSVDGESGTWSTQNLSCSDTPNPDGGTYEVTEEDQGEHKGAYRINPALKPGHSIRCTATLPALTFDPGFKAAHSDTVTVVGIGEKSRVESQPAEDPWNAEANAAKLEVVKYSGVYTDSEDDHSLGSATEDAKEGSDAVGIAPQIVDETFTPSDKTVFYTFKNTGFEDMVRVKLADQPLTTTVGTPGEPTNANWVIDGVSCDVSAYDGAVVSAASDATQAGESAIEITFTDQAPLKIGDSVTCQSTLKYVGDPLNLSDSIWHANEVTVSGFGISNKDKETPESEDPWNARSAAPDVSIIKYIGEWDSSLQWDGTKTGDLPVGDSDTALKRGGPQDKQKAVFLQPENIGSDDDPVYMTKEQKVGFTVRNTGKVALDTLVIEDYDLPEQANSPVEFQTGPLMCAPGAEGLQADATVIGDPDNPKKVTIRFTEENLFEPGHVFSCHASLAATQVDPRKGVEHANEVSIQGWRKDQQTRKTTDPAHAYSVVPSLNLTKESIGNDGQTFDKRAGTGSHPDIVKLMQAGDDIITQPVPIRFTIATNGMDPLQLSTLKVVDRRDVATEGWVTFDDTTIPATLTLKDGNIVTLEATVGDCEDPSGNCSQITFADPMGKVSLLAEGDTITYEGTLGKTAESSMKAGKLHHDLAEVEGVGEESNITVKSTDDYHAKSLKPDSHTSKYSDIPGVDQTKQEQLANNTCDGGEDGEVCVIPNAPDKDTSAAFTVFMEYTNTGEDDLTQIKMTDTTTQGIDLTVETTAVIGVLDEQGEITNPTAVYMNPTDSMFYKNGDFTDVAVLRVGQTLRVEGTMPEGGLDQGNHADTVKFGAMGVFSDFPTESEDPYESTREEPHKPDKPGEDPKLPHTGSDAGLVGALGLLTVLAGIGLIRRAHRQTNNG